MDRAHGGMPWGGAPLRRPSGSGDGGRGARAPSEPDEERSPVAVAAARRSSFSCPKSSGRRKAVIRFLLSDAVSSGVRFGCTRGGTRKPLRTRGRERDGVGVTCRPHHYSLALAPRRQVRVAFLPPHDPNPAAGRTARSGSRVLQKPPLLLHCPPFQPLSFPSTSSPATHPEAQTLAARKRKSINSSQKPAGPTRL
jgi:hypothetical protein